MTSVIVCRFSEKIGVVWEVAAIWYKVQIQNTKLYVQWLLSERNTNMNYALSLVTAKLVFHTASPVIGRVNWVVLFVYSNLAVDKYESMRCVAGFVFCACDCCETRQHEVVAFWSWPSHTIYNSFKLKKCVKYLKICLNF